MPQDDDEDIFNEEFDLVDDEDDSSTDEESDVVGEDEGDEPVSEDKARGSRSPKRNASRKDEPSEDDAAEEVQTDENLDEFGRPKPVANYVVHVYEFDKYKRTIDRPFTPEDAEAFATEYNRPSKSYRRLAVAGKNDVAPPKDLPVQKATS